MTDRGLLVVISKMLRKQDQQSEKLDEHSAILSQHTEILNRHTEILNQQTEILNKQTNAINETTTTLKEFMQVSINQFQQQQAFNERFFDKLSDIKKALTK